MATWIIGLIVIGAVYMAAKHVLKVHKSGGCVGCSAGDGKECCCHCTEIKLKKK